MDVVCLLKEHVPGKGKHLNVSCELLRILGADPTAEVASTLNSMCIRATGGAVLSLLQQQTNLCHCTFTNITNLRKVRSPISSALERIMVLKLQEKTLVVFMQHHFCGYAATEDLQSPEPFCLIRSLISGSPFPEFLGTTPFTAAF